MSFIGAIIIGGIAGWIAEHVMQSRMGLLGNILLGIVGGMVGAWLAGLGGIVATALPGRLLIATGGACVLIFVGRVVRGKA